MYDFNEMVLEYEEKMKTLSSYEGQEERIKTLKNPDTITVGELASEIAKTDGFITVAELEMLLK